MDKQTKINYKDLINKVKPEMEKLIENLDNEFKKIRSGRTSTELIENVVVECFGERFPLQKLAVFSIPEPRQILVQPWDKSYLEPILKSLQNMGGGLSISNQGDAIKVSVPAVSEDYKKSIIKIIAQKSEEVKQKIRRLRDDIWTKIQNETRLGNIREDDKFKSKKELQKIVDELSEKIKLLKEKKEKEIMD